MNKIAPYWKSIVGFIAPGAVIIGSAVLEGSDGGAKITQAEWATAIVAMVITSAGVFGAANKDPDALHQDESVQPPYEGRHEL